MDTVNTAQDGWENSFTFKSPSPNQVDTLWEFVSIVGVCSEEGSLERSCKADGEIQFLDMLCVCKDASWWDLSNVLRIPALTQTVISY